MNALPAQVVTKSPFVVVHFFHKDFERCKIMDMHLKTLATQYFETRFVKISGPDAPFFVAKLQVQMLPCVIMFQNGVAIDRVVGFEELGGRDDFDIAMLEARLMACGVLKRRVRTGDESDDEEHEQRRNAVRIGGPVRGYRNPHDDEDSDFED